MRIEPPRLVEVGEGAVVVTHIAIGDAAAVVGIGIFWIKPDRLVEVGDGAVVVTLRLIRATTGEVEHVNVCIEVDRLAAIGYRPIRFGFVWVRPASVLEGPR